ncbi:hypothetical protein DFJ77DRAFT_20875 [Powellomyces hirtus]|nr:hypothetical protein DFJ77DRAFT_20875 [Powellomyces hirtus]
MHFVVVIDTTSAHMDVDPQTTTGSSSIPSTSEPPSSLNDHPNVTSTPSSNSPSASAASRNQFVRSMLEAVLSSLSALETSQSAGASGAASQSNANPMRPSSPNGTATAHNARLAEILQSIQSRAGGPSAPPTTPASEGAPPGFASLLRNLRGRALGRHGLGSGADTALPTSTTLLGSDPRRSPVPVLILIGRAVRGANSGTPAGSSDASETAPAAAEGSSSSDVPPAAADGNRRSQHRRSSRLFGEFTGQNDSASASFAESLLAAAASHGQPPEQIGSTTATNSSATDASDATSSATFSTGGETYNTEDAAAGTVRRSISFMIYFIPSGSNRTETGGVSARATSPATSANEASAQPDATPAAPPAEARDGPSIRLPFSDILEQMASGTHAFPSVPSVPGHPPSSPSAHAVPSPSAGPAPGLHPPPLNLFPQMEGASLTGTASAVGAIPGLGHGPRNMIEEFAITIILQIVSNMLREGSMNGPGGLLGGTLSLDIGDPVPAEGAGLAGAGGGTGTGGEGGMSYDDFLRLAEILGPARPRHATAADVDRELPIIKFGAEASVDAMDVDVEHSQDTTDQDHTSEESKQEGSSEGEQSSKITWRMEDLVPATREKCMICLSMYESGEDVRVMRCRHGFHKTCLDQWLTQYVNSCPLCRDKAVSPPTAPTSATSATQADGNSMQSDTTDNESQQVPHTAPAGERRGFLRRMWEMFGSGRFSAGASAPAAVPAEGGERSEGDRGLPAAVVVLLG